jgi:hypothetical protein
VVFAPLGMIRSNVGPNAGTAAGQAVRYSRDGSRLPNYATGCPPAADVCSSVRDLLRFGRLHLGTLGQPGAAVLSAASIEEMRSASVPMGNEKEYGIGWVITTDRRGRKHVGHGGAGAGIDAQLTLVPEEKLAVAVLINTHIDRHLAGEIADLTLRALLGESAVVPVPRAAESRGPAATPAPWVGTWTGVVSTLAREIPVTLSFAETGRVTGSLESRPTIAIEEPRFENGRFSGRMEGNIGTPEAARRPYHLEWELTLRDGVLNGILNAIGAHPSRGVSLGYWVEMTKRG